MRTNANGKTSGRFVLAAALSAGVLVLFASGAQANGFEDAFEHELGRIAAHEAVYAGKHILGAVLLGYPGQHGRHYSGYGQRRHYSGHGHRRHHGNGHYGHHYSPHACGYGGHAGHRSAHKVVHAGYRY